MPRGLLYSHPTGNTYVRAALTGLYEAGMLAEFHTSLACYPGNIWDFVGRAKFGREFRRRSFDERLRPLTVQHPMRELGRMMAARAHLPGLVRHETGVFCVDAVFRQQDRATARRLKQRRETFTGVYAHEDGALETFLTARELGLRRIYELPIAYWQTLRQLLAEEAERLPNWAVTLGGGVGDSEGKLERKTRELELSEVVICPSLFVARSLPGKVQKEKKIVVSAFGSPAIAKRNGDFAVNPKRKLRVLFAGSLSQRKGLGDLFAAMRLLNRPDVELVMMGGPQAPMEFYRKEYDAFIYEATRPHEEVLELMRSCDILCLPSIIEGRALVMQEAMSQGLPLIVTANTGGEDLIEEGITGFLVPVRRPDAIAEKIAWFADNRSQLPEMSRAAQAKAAELTWASYCATIIRALRN